MDRFAVFVDAASLHAQVSQELTGVPSRAAVDITSPAGYAAAIRDWACSVVDLPLLRVYWFDGERESNVAELRRVEATDGIKLQRGRVIRVDTRNDQTGHKELVCSRRASTPGFTAR